MTDVSATLTRLHGLEEQAVLKAGPGLDRPEQMLEGRRKVAVGAAWLVLARDASDFRERVALNSVGWHLRQAQRILDRELGE